jgi:NADPH:quinone reductase-like Zn-dependent oxidoreductase
MRALRIHAHGGPQVMRLEDIPTPEPAEGERLVKIVAASVNPIDWKIRQGLYRMNLPRVLGRDGAGTDVITGERILGIGSPGRDGTHAEYAVFSNKVSAIIPGGVSFEEATALGIAALSAWIPLVENAKVSAVQRVLIHAGAGGVGSFAIQIARERGAEVWTTCSARNAEWCRALGAHRMIDYEREDFVAMGSIFDVVFDIVGGAVHRRSAEVLKPGGVLAYLQAAPRETPQRQDIRVLPTEVRATPERLSTLLSLVSQGKLKVPVEARFPLERAAEAYELSRSGHARGKIVLTIEVH